MRVFRSIPAIICLCAAAAIPLSARAQGAPNKPAVEKADELYRKGNQALGRNQLREAQSAYRDAFALKKSYDIAGNLGSVELALGMHRDAAEHLSYSLRFFPVNSDAKGRDATRRALAEAKRKVGALTIRVNATGAEVSIDGKAVGRAPLGDEIFVDPGSHEIEAKLAGHVAVSHAVDAQAGKETTVELTLQREEPPPPRPAETAQPTSPASVLPVERAPTAPPVELAPRPIERAPDSSAAPSLVLGWIGAGVAVGAVATGIGFAVAAHGEMQDAKAFDKLGASSACKLPSPPAECEDLRKTLERRDQYTDVSTVAFVTGGVFAVATVTYFILRATPRTSAMRLDPYVGATQSGLVLSGGF